MPKSSRSSFPVSTVEWIASLYMAALPVTSAAPNLQIAIATLPAIAAMMTRSEPECSATIPPPLRRRYVINTGWPLSAVALGGVAFAPKPAFGCPGANRSNQPFARLTVRQAVAEKQEATGARVALLAINLDTP